MDGYIKYQVLAPDSVAWYIQAALVADRNGNEHTRDLALSEAQRIAAERRLVEGPAPAGSRVLAYDVEHECNGVRLATIERRQWEDAETFGEHARRLDALERAQRVEHRTMHATFNEHQARLEKLEAAAAPAMANRATGQRDGELVQLENGEIVMRRDCGVWIRCPFCEDDEKGMCSACNGTRRIWEMPRE